MQWKLGRLLSLGCFHSFADRTYVVWELYIYLCFEIFNKELLTKINRVAFIYFIYFLLIFTSKEKYDICNLSILFIL